MKKVLHVGGPNVGNRAELVALVCDMFDRNWLTNDGPLVQEFESKLAVFLGVRHVVAVCNATIGLELAIRALGLAGEVIVPSFTFVATAHAVQWQGIKPVFCDVAPQSHNIDPSRIEELITPLTTGIIGVHVWGHVCQVHSLQDIADRHGLALFFDAAHAFGCKPIGKFGDAEVFSFHATKFFNTFEGGCIATNDEVLATRLRFMRNFGFAAKDDVQHIGTNAKMCEVAAAMGLVNLKSIDKVVQVNKRNYELYLHELRDLPGVYFYAYDDDGTYNYQYVVLEIVEDEAGISRNDLMLALHRQNVIARRYFYPGVHRMEPYASYQPQAGLVLPETEALVERVLLLPTGTTVGTDDVRRVCDAIKGYVK